MKKALAALVTIALAGPVSAADEAIFIMGGRGHDIFLGCINCAESASNSVWNSTSKYGWANQFGLWNEFGPHGGAYGTNSACNEYTNTPPVLVDQTGRSYGYLTVNQFKPGSVCSISGGEGICQALKVMCAHSSD